MYTQHPAPMKQANIQVTPTHNNVGGASGNFGQRIPSRAALSTLTRHSCH